MKHLLGKAGTGAVKAVLQGLCPLLLLGTVLWMHSCVNDDNPDNRPNPDSGEPVAFGVGTSTSRAVATTSLKKFGVFGYSHMGNYTAAAAAAKPDYFLNTPVTDPTGSGSWNYTGVMRYWPMTGAKLSFFAYAPYDDLGQYFGLTPSSLAAVGVPAVDYTVPADIRQQIDIMWANCFDQLYNSNGGVVDFEMNHALTKINFQVKLKETESDRPLVVTINELVVKNIVGNGVLDLSKTMADLDDIWSIEAPQTSADLTEYVMTPATGLLQLILDARNTNPAPGEFDPFEFNGVFDAGQYLMLIPQAINDLGGGLTQAQVTLKYTAENVYSGEIIADEVTLNLSQGSLLKWSAGQSVNYCLTLSLLEGTDIEFDIQGMIVATPWEKESPIDGAVN